VWTYSLEVGNRPTAYILAEEEEEEEEKKKKKKKKKLNIRYLEPEVSSPLALRSILTLFSCLCLDLPSCLFLQVLRLKCFVHLSFLIRN
jgi:hypothetical protein